MKEELEKLLKELESKIKDVKDAINIIRKERDVRSNGK